MKSMNQRMKLWFGRVDTSQSGVLSERDVCDKILKFSPDLCVEHISEFLVECRCPNDPNMIDYNMLVDSLWPGTKAHPNIPDHPGELSSSSTAAPYKDSLHLSPTTSGSTEEGSILTPTERADSKDSAQSSKYNSADVAAGLDNHSNSADAAAGQPQQICSRRSSRSVEDGNSPKISKDVSDKRKMSKDSSSIASQVKEIVEQLSPESAQAVLAFAQSKNKAQQNDKNWVRLHETTRHAVGKLLDAADLSFAFKETKCMSRADYCALRYFINDVKIGAISKRRSVLVSSDEEIDKDTELLGDIPDAEESFGQETIAAWLVGNVFACDAIQELPSETYAFVDRVCTRLRSRKELVKYTRLDQMFQTMALYNDCFHRIRQEAGWNDIPHSGDNACEQPPEICIGNSMDEVLTSLFKTAVIVEGYTKNLCSEISLCHGVLLTRMGPLKKWERARQKIVLDYGGNPRRILDLVRCSVICESMESIQTLMEFLEGRPDMKCTRVKSGFNSSVLVTPTGYRDVKVTACFIDCPLLFEIQLQLKEFYLINKEMGHKIFAWTRVLSPWAISSPEDVVQHGNSEVLHGMCLLCGEILSSTVETTGHHSQASQQARILLVEVLSSTLDESTIGKHGGMDHANDLILFVESPENVVKQSSSAGTSSAKTSRNLRRASVDLGSSLKNLLKGRAYRAYGMLMGSLNQFAEARDALSQGMEFAQTAHDILMIARLHQTIGQVCTLERDYHCALLEYRLAAEQLATALGENHPGTAVARICVAEALAHGGLFSVETFVDSEVQTLRDACAHVLQYCGRRHPYVAKGYLVKSKVLRELGRHIEAKQEAELAVEVYRETHGPTAQQTRDALLELGLAEWGAGYNDQAVSHIEDAAASASSKSKQTESCEVVNPKKLNGHMSFEDYTDAIIVSGKESSSLRSDALLSEFVSIEASAGEGSTGLETAAARLSIIEARLSQEAGMQVRKMRSCDLVARVEDGKTEFQFSPRPEILKDDLASLSLTEFKYFLDQHLVHTDEWTEEHLTALHKALQEDAGYFEAQSGILGASESLVYVLPTLVLTVRPPAQPTHFLQEVGRQGGKSGVQKATKPAIRLLRQESLVDAVARFVDERFIVPLPDLTIQVQDVLLSGATTSGHTSKSRTYPGLQTKYVRTFLEVIVEGLPEEGFVTGSKRMGRCREYRWMDEFDAEAFEDNYVAPSAESACSKRGSRKTHMHLGSDTPGRGLAARSSGGLGRIETTRSREDIERIRAPSRTDEPVSPRPPFSEERSVSKVSQEDPMSPRINVGHSCASIGSSESLGAKERSGALPKI